MKIRKIQAACVAACVAGCVHSPGFCDDATRQVNQPMACYEPAILDSRDQHGRSRNYSLTCLSKLFDQQPGPLLILKQTSTGRLILNPQGDEYPKTMPIKDLSSKDALFLFGKPKTANAEMSTYELMFANGGKSFFQLQAKFNDNKLTSYRIRNHNQACSSPWENVD